jgi:glycosyltransferase involved in cell wall biosynthesis
MKNLLELVMIVKNAGELLRECLRENRKWIDHWTILDTGSTDNTIDIIKEELKDVEGNLYFSEFIDFSQARNKCLDLSSKTCKYQIMLDDSYVINGGKELRKLLNKSNEPCFLIKVGYYDDKVLKNDYYSKRIIKTTNNLRKELTGD